MATSDRHPKKRREHERIEIQMRARLWLDETFKGRRIQFEGFAETRNLAIGGTLLTSTYLLSTGFPINMEFFLDDSEPLRARGTVIHHLTSDDGEALGMGVRFTSVDVQNRERLLRYFVTERLRNFYYERFIVEFPHLERVLSLQDVALTVNLWEDKEGRLTAIGKPDDV